MDFLLWGTEKCQNPMNEILRFVCMPTGWKFWTFHYFWPVLTFENIRLCEIEGEQIFVFFSVNSKIINFLKKIYQTFENT
jgi:hypothetical protein